MHTRFSFLLTFIFVLSISLSGQERVAYVGGSDREHPVLSYAFTGVKEVKFTLDGGIILVEAMLDNTPQTFILDSGAPGLVLNNYVKKGRKEKVTGINGTVDAYSVTINNFSWADITFPALEAISTDLSHLESMTNRKISGLIGYELLKDFELLLDYETEAIRIKSLSPEFNISSTPIVSFPLSFESHLPVIEVTIGEEKLRLGLDTGAEINVLDHRLSDRIASVSSTPQPYKKIYGVGENDTPAQLINVELTRVERAAYRQMDYVLTDFSAVTGNQTDLDGILGFPFLSSCKFSIDFINQKLHVWP